MLTIPEEIVLNANKTTTEIIERYLRNGIRLVLDNYHPDRLPEEQIKGMGFAYVRPAPELYLKPETASMIKRLRRNGFTVLGGGVDSHDALCWLTDCGAAFMSGTITGVTVNENELIRDCLIRER